MMNFSAFGGPFSGIHQIAAKFGHETQNATLDMNVTAAGGGGEANGQRYHNAAVNGFGQNESAVTNNAMHQYNQNIAISIPYTQPQTDFLTDNKGKISSKIVRDRETAFNQQILQNVNQSWQTLANTANTVDYSSHLLPISIQHFLKYSETIKKESSGIVTSPLNSANLAIGNSEANNLNLKGEDGKTLSITVGNRSIPATSITVSGNTDTYGGINCIDGSTFPHDIKPTAAVADGPTATTTTAKKPKKKKALKEKKPRPKPGEIRETKALDGSALFCCPECQMAYSDRSLIEQHVISHAVERRFVCDVCNAALKRKDHLTRHKLSHIPDRPHVCNICMKSFKRKEQLTLHIVIHSGEKKHVCQECGKGFYRKDHLRKHTRSHIARRVKSEVSSHHETTTKNAPQGS